MWVYTLSPGPVSGANYIVPSDAVLIGKPTQLYKGGLVGIFEIADTYVNAGDEVILSTRGDYKLAIAVSIQQDDANVETATLGNYGIMFDEPLHRNTEVWVRSKVKSIL